MAINFESGSHWYECRNGEPRPKHDADLRVARKELLYPSVTSIDKNVFKNSFLDQWKMEQIVLAACEHPRHPHEDADSYSNRLYQLSLDKPRDAADFGTSIHDCIEKYPSEPTNPELLPWFLRYKDWHEANILEVVSSEKIMVDHDLGVAGRCDRVAIHKTLGKVVIDYKTQNVKSDKKGNKVPAFYESWPRQLGFYSVCEAKEDRTFPSSIPASISLVFDSNSPETPLGEKVWEKSEILFNYRQFVCGAWLWFSGNAKRKAYWPRGEWTVNPSTPMPI